MSVQDYAAVGDPLRTVVDVRRFVNDSIRKLAVQNGMPSFDFVCECGDLRCREFVTLSIEEYDSSWPGSLLAH